MTESEAVKLIGVLKMAYPSVAVDRSQAALYAEMLDDLELEDVLRAVKAHIRSSKWFPTIAEIRERVVEARDERSTGAIAWGEVLRAVGSQGRYRAPTFSSPAITEAVRLVGWQSICNAPDDMLGATRRQWIETYDAICARDRKAALLGGTQPPALPPAAPPVLEGPERPALPEARLGATQVGKVVELVTRGRRG